MHTPHAWFHQQHIVLSVIALGTAVCLTLLIPEGQASTIGIDEVTSLRSTAHSLLEAGEQNQPPKVQSVSHWLLINQDIKWQWDEDALKLDEAFVNTQYDTLNPSQDEETALKFTF
jgi:hypothetical protein